MDNENYPEKRIIAIDAQNVAFWPCGSYKPKDWRLVLQVAKYYHELGHEVAVFVPTHYWTSGEEKSIPRELKEELNNFATIEAVNCEDDSERDDKIMISFSYLMDAYYVTNDKKMSSHFKLNTLENRAWCHSRRIEFSFDVDGKFVPCLDIESMDDKLNESSEQTTAGKEVRL
jgi:hypothetical protein